MPIMNTLVITTAILGLLVVVLLVLTTVTMMRLKRLTRGNTAGSLESVIRENNHLVKEVKDKLKNQEIQILDIKKAAMDAIHNVGVVRFNPFKETGGSQSFAVALTDKRNNGVVISSLYARERVNIFAKPIINGTSTYTLSGEELQALKESQTN
ncbi:MAG: hypothetical protein ACJAV6_000639 [Candidatus Paceibacteria bacterium]|jgi:hypothetical protein